MSSCFEKVAELPRPSPWTASPPEDAPGLHSHSTASAISSARPSRGMAGAAAEASRQRGPQDPYRPAEERDPPRGTQLLGQGMGAFHRFDTRIRLQAVAGAI